MSSLSGDINMELYRRSHLWKSFRHALKRLIIQAAVVLIVLSQIGLSTADSVQMAPQDYLPDCSALLLGQYYCQDPEIDNSTQQALGCRKETLRVKVPCYTAPGLLCKNEEDRIGNQSVFFKEVPCKWTNGVSFKTTLLLSIFLGMLGMDRFYLGYPAIGMLKFCTFGFMFLGQLVDILLIALQVVGPSDGSSYIIDFYGAGLTRIDRNNNTYVKPQEYS